MTKYREGRLGEVTFYDACQLWGISPRSSAMELEGRLANFVAVVATARNGLTSDEAAFVHGGERYSLTDLDDALELHDALVARFASELATIRRRTDERLG